MVAALAPAFESYPKAGKPDTSVNVQETLFVIAVCSNPVRYASRYRLFREFVARMKKTKNVVLIQVEHAFGKRPHEVTDPNDKNHLQLRGGSEYEIWLKEGLVNAGLKHLYATYPNWKYMAWVDADISFDDEDWASETIHALQHYSIVQPWAKSFDMGPDGKEEIHSATSFMHDYVNEIEKKWAPKAETWHPGYAWAARREAIDDLGGKVIDWCILGAGDHHMAWAFVGDIWKGVHGEMGSEYMRKAREFQELCDKYIKSNVGYVEGTIRHYWHGPKKKRYYVERWDILVKNRFNPDLDFATDKWGVPFLTGNKPKLRDGIRKYLRARDEDSVATD